MPRMTGSPPAAVRRRRNKDTMERIRGERRGRTPGIAPSDAWRTDVRNYFNSALASGQSDFYENSDVMSLYLQCELLDRILRSTRLEPLYERSQDDEGNWRDVLDEDGNRIPLMDQWGRPDYRVIGQINGQALKAALDMGENLLMTEGARRRLRIDLTEPDTGEESPEKAIIAEQRKGLATVTPIRPVA